MSAAKTAYPKVRVILVEALSGDLAGSLAAGLLDIATLYRHQVRSEQIQEILRTDRLVIAGPHKSLVFEDQNIHLKSVLDLPLILPSPRHGLRNLVDAAAASTGKKLHIDAEVDSLTAIQALLRQGNAYSILPARRAEDVTPTDECAGYTEMVIPDLHREIVLARSRALRRVAVIEIAKLMFTLEKR
jgi:LysR family tcuABC transcriptional regulator